MKKRIETIIIFFLFLLIGVLAFFASYILNSFKFFYNHEHLTFFLISIICVTIYGKCMDYEDTEHWIGVSAI